MKQGSQPKRRRDDIVLSPEQQALYDRITEGRENIFMTGPAGVGKSAIIIKVARYFRSKKILCLKTSMIGSAAIMIGGRTLHSTLGLGSQDYYDPGQVISSMEKAGKIDFIKRIAVLIIDEVHMLSDLMFEMISLALGIVRNNQAPMGGIQTILGGDLMQLPPVVKIDRERGTGARSKYNREGHYIINSTEWRRGGFDVGTVVLSKVMRTKDPLLMKIQSQVRKGKLQPEYRRELKRIVTDRDPIDFAKIGWVCLFARNDQVNALNNEMNDALEGDPVVYLAKESNAEDVHRYLPNAQIPKRLEIKVGTEVMYTVNRLDHYNGERGVVTEFTERFGGIVPMVYFYIRSDPQSDDTPSDERKRRAVPILPETVELLDDHGKPFVWRMNIPLRPAWAMSIHRSTGLTFRGGVFADTRRAFVPGQVYVAISRATSLNMMRLASVPNDIEYSTFCMSYYTNAKILQLRKESEAITPLAVLLSLPGSTSSPLAPSSSTPGPYDALYMELDEEMIEVIERLEGSTATMAEEIGKELASTGSAPQSSEEIRAIIERKDVSSLIRSWRSKGEDWVSRAAQIVSEILLLESGSVSEMMGEHHGLANNPLFVAHMSIEAPDLSLGDLIKSAPEILAIVDASYKEGDTETARTYLKRAISLSRSDRKAGEGDRKEKGKEKEQSGKGEKLEEEEEEEEEEDVEMIQALIEAIDEDKES